MENGRQTNIRTSIPQEKNLALPAFYGTYQPSRIHEGIFSGQKEYKKCSTDWLPRNMDSGSKPERNQAKSHPDLILSQSLGLMFLTN